VCASTLKESSWFDGVGVFPTHSSGELDDNLGGIRWCAAARIYQLGPTKCLQI
jgi:hypothetical protein